MFYQEQLIDGVLHYRHSPKGEWIPFTLKQLSERVKTQLELLRNYDDLSDDFNEILDAEKSNRIKRTETFIPAFEDDTTCHFFWIKNKE